MTRVRAEHQRSELEGRFRLLMLRSLTGDSQAYRQLLGELSGHLRSYFARGIGGWEVEALVQETLLALHSKRDSYDQGLPFTPWVRAIARYKLADYFRRKRALRIPIEDAGDLFAIESPEQDTGLTDLGRPSERPPNRPRAARVMLTPVLKWLAQTLGVRGRRPRV